MKKILEHTAIWAAALFMYLPILVLTVYSFTDSAMIGTIRSFSLQNYVTLFTEPELINMMSQTVILALGVAALSTLLGTCGAIGAFYSRKGVRRSLDLLNEIPVVNADVVTGFSVCILMIAVFHMDKETYIPLVIGQTSLCAPFVYLSVMPRLKQLDPQLYEAALDLGCRPFQALIKILIPQIFPGIISGFMTAITLSLDDYFIASYTKPATFDTISTYVVNATRGSQTTIKTALWALSAVIFALVVLFVVLMNLKPEPKKEEER